VLVEEDLVPMEEDADQAASDPTSGVPDDLTDAYALSEGETSQGSIPPYKMFIGHGSGSKQFALLGDTFVGIGDMVNEYEVLEISETEVVLKTTRGNPQSVPLEGLDDQPAEPFLIAHDQEEGGAPLSGVQ
jgi:hypothetical protein